MEWKRFEKFRLSVSILWWCFADGDDISSVRIWIKKTICIFLSIQVHSINNIKYLTN